MKNQAMMVTPVTAQLKEQCPVDASIAKFNITELSKQLKHEEVWHSKKRNSVTVFKSDDLHILLIAMHAVTRMLGHKVEVPLTIQVLEGRIKVITEKETLALGKSNLLVLESGISHDIEAIKESVFLLTWAIGKGARVAVRQKEKAMPEVCGG